jgi:hypothetical protein
LKRVLKLWPLAARTSDGVRAPPAICPRSSSKRGSLLPSNHTPVEQHRSSQRAAPDERLALEAILALERDEVEPFLLVIHVVADVQPLDLFEAVGARRRRVLGTSAYASRSPARRQGAEGSRASNWVLPHLGSRLKTPSDRARPRRRQGLTSEARGERRRESPSARAPVLGASFAPFTRRLRA